MENSSISFKNVSKSFGKLKIIDSLCFDLAPGRIYSLIGESGSGKTTALRLMNGLVQPDEGEVYIDGARFDYENSVELRRQMGYSIQSSGLFPHMSVFENISFVARRCGWTKQMLKARAEELLSVMHLDPKVYLEKKPRQLSGGQRQRVGIARALFLKPKIVLMDEPFGALDPLTRQEIQDWFIQIQEEYRFSVVLVTHDLSEAFKMSDKIMLINSGKIEQFGRPSDLLLKPSSEFVSQFLSSHSPSHVLKNVHLYSMINRGLWATFWKEDGTYLLTDLANENTEPCKDAAQLRRFHETNHQNYIFFVKENLSFVGQVSSKESDFSGMHKVSLSHKEHFLRGVRCFIQEGSRPLPVVNEHNVLLGCFSEEAIHALS